LGRIDIAVSYKISQLRGKLKLVQHFVDYCSRALSLKNDYMGCIVDNRKMFGIETTAVCNYSNRLFLVYGRNRSFVDILRSIAHELVHFHQHEIGERKDDELHFASVVEDDANAISAQLVNAFATVTGYDIIYERKEK